MIVNIHRHMMLCAMHLIPLLETLITTRISVHSFGQISILHNKLTLFFKMVFQGKIDQITI
jgi:hypothetical protein